jgi:hypothetical protein
MRERTALVARAMTDTATKLAILVEGALAAGVGEAQPFTDKDGELRTVTKCWRVRLLRAINSARRGTDRIGCVLLDDGEDDARLLSKGRLFTLQEHGAEPPELVLHDLM